MSDVAIGPTGAVKPARTIHTTFDDSGILWLVVDVPDEPLNVINEHVIIDLEAELDDLESQLRGPGAFPEAPRALVLISGKSGAFFAGADLRLIRSARTAGEASDAARRLQGICNRIEGLPITTVAAIDGAALGGGLELALACDYRVVAHSTKKDLGLVEVQIGLIPAGGGCQRLPRVIGLSRSLPMILAGTRVTPARAKRIGLVDDVVHPTILREAARRWSRKPAPRESRKLSLQDRLLENTKPGRNLVFRRAEKSVRKRAGNRYPAPYLAIDAIRTGLEQSVSVGLEAEARNFGALATSLTTRNLIDLFLDSNGLKRDQGIGETEAPTQVGIVGAGLMGAGIAQAAAMSGSSVRVKEISEQGLAVGLKRIDRLVSQAQRGRVIDRYESGRVRSRISGSTGYSGFGRAQLVVEAAVEDLDVKRLVIADLESAIGSDTVIGTNTSALPIVDVAREAVHPERIIGIHFFSPVHKMPLVEVIRGPRTSDNAVNVAVAFGRSLGKHVVVVADGPGFFTTRVLGFMLAEAVELLEEGTDMRAIDKAMVEFGFPIGPMTLMDEVGLDVARHVALTLATAFPERLARSAVLDDLEKVGKGKRDGRGFYVYDGKKKQPNPAVESLHGRGSHRAPAAEIQERLSLLFVNEAARCLDEKVIASGRDGDLASIFGLGFPPFLGGPFRYVDIAGPSVVAERLRVLAGRYGPRYDPARPLISAPNNSFQLRSTEFPMTGEPRRGPGGELIGLTDDNKR